MALTGVGGEWLVGVLLEALHCHVHQGTPLGTAGGAIWAQGLLVWGGIFRVRGQKRLGGVAVGKGEQGDAAGWPGRWGQPQPIACQFGQLHAQHDGSQNQRTAQQDEVTAAAAATMPSG